MGCGASRISRQLHLPTRELQQGATGTAQAAPQHALSNDELGKIGNTRKSDNAEGFEPTETKADIHKVVEDETDGSVTKSLCNVPDMNDKKAPPPKDDKAPPPKDDKAPPPKDDKALPPKDDKAPPPKDDKAPTPKDDKTPPPKDDKAPPPKDDKAPPPTDDKASPPKDDKAPPPKDDKAPPQ
ncbi:hypothetical protein EMCRGX_G021269 [Ephydatia muelleri]